MNVVVITLTLALVAGHAYAVIDFAAGKTYVYKYEAFLLGGLPEQGLARAGLKVNTKVLFSATTENMYMLKLVEPELSEYSGIWPKDPLTPASKLTSALAPQLTTPIKFEYANGVVGKLMAPEGVSTLVLNIYRGILNVLQLNIKKTQNVYELQEAGAQGVCRTLYAITEDEKAERILLTKSRDLNHCHEEVMRDIGLTYTEKCPKCQRNLKGATAYDYVLKPVANGMLILEAAVNELIQFSPFSEKNGAAQMETKQSLTFLEIQNASIVPVEAQYLHRGSLQYEFSTELLQTPLRLIKISNVQAQIVEILNHLVTNNMNEVHEDAPQKFLELIQVLRAAHLLDLQNLWSQYRNRPTYRQWILDAIPAIGTSDALRFIKEKYLANELTVAETAQALIASVHMVAADTEVIRLYEELATSKKILEQPILREIVLLGYGTMVYKNCTERSACPVELIKPIQDLLAEAVANRDTQNIILLLKVLGNAGHPSSIKPLTKILPIHGTAAASLPERVHTEAILALRNIAKKEPRMIQDLALQLYMDKALHPEIRMLACMVLFETRPPMGLVISLASVVKREKNLQVASFTYSYMKSLTRSSSVMYDSVSAACNVAVKIMNPALSRMNMRFSKAVYADIFNNHLMLGAAATAFYINDAATVLPRTVVAKTSAYFTGAAADVFEVGVRTEGLQEAILKNPSISQSTDRITKMKRVIKALSQWRSQPQSSPLASIYVKFFGQEIAFANIDKARIDQIISMATGPSAQEYGRDVIKTLLSGASFHIAKPMLATEVRRIVPTAAGLPMELSLYTAAVATAAVQVKATTTPVLPENFHLANLLKTNMQLETQIRPSIAANTFVVMGVNTAVLQATLQTRAKVNSILPSKISARLDINEGNFKMEILPVSAPEQVAAVHVETFAVARNIEDFAAAKTTPLIPANNLEPRSSQILTSKSSSASASLSPSSEMFERPNMKPKVAQFEKKYCAVAIGLKSCVKIMTDNAAFLKDIPLYRLSGRHSVSLSWKQIEGEAIERLEMEVQVGPKAAELIKQINRSDEELVEGKNILMKLRRILVPGQKNSTLSSSHSSKSTLATNSRLTSSRSVRRSSYAQSFEWLFNTHSSSSRSSTRFSKEMIYEPNFQKHHKSQARSSQATSGKHSMSRTSSFETIYQKNKYLASEVAPVFATIFRAIRADKKVQGYQVAMYLDRPTARIQIILAALAADDNWRLCADGILLSKFKVTAKLAWGEQCKQYDTSITAETGLVGQSPAARLKVRWNNLPSAVKRYAQRAYDYIPADMLDAYIKGKDEKSPEQLSFTVVAASDKKIDIVWKTPMNIVYQLSLNLPVELPFDRIHGLTPLNNIVDKAQYLFSMAGATQCSFKEGTLTTFNNRKYKNERPLSCYQVVAQDCTDELKFMVLLRKDEHEQNHLNVKIDDIDIDLYLKNSNVAVKVNGLEITNLPYQSPKAEIKIERTDEGISVKAPSHGLLEVYYDKSSWRIKAVDWMKGKTCGLCGKADGEVRQEFRTPSGRLTKSPVSYAHSWVLPAENCRDTSECRMKLESVKLEKLVNILGRQSRCFSVEPVLRCLPGCYPVKTTNVNVGFHCLPEDSAVNQQEKLLSISDNSVDLKETTEAHLACSCTPQCA